MREGSLEAPTRHPLDWKNPQFWDQAKAEKELERIFDICHGCRRCVSLCTAFPTLFDLVDASSTMEVDGVSKSDYGKVVDQCYLCDLCYMTKCPYVPPHPWNVDFPHVMLRAKAIKFEKGIKFRDRLLSSTDAMGKLAAIPVVAQTVNFANRNTAARSARLAEDQKTAFGSSPTGATMHCWSMRRQANTQSSKGCCARSTLFRCRSSSRRPLRK